MDLADGGWTPRFLCLKWSVANPFGRRLRQSALFSRQTDVCTAPPPPNICTWEISSIPFGSRKWGVWFVPGAALSLGGVEVPLKMQVRLEFRLGMLLELVLDVLDLELWYDCYNLICIELV